MPWGLLGSLRRPNADFLEERAPASDEKCESVDAVFSGLAFLVAPRNARSCVFLVARCARSKCGFPARFERAVSLGHANAYMQLGNLYEEDGFLAEARRLQG